MALIYLFIDNWQMDFRIYDSKQGMILLLPFYMKSINLCYIPTVSKVLDIDNWT